MRLRHWVLGTTFGLFIACSSPGPGSRATAEIGALPQAGMAGPTTSSVWADEAKGALRILEKTTGLEPQGEVDAIFDGYLREMEVPVDTPERLQHLVMGLETFKWGGRISETVDLAKTLFSYRDEADRNQLGPTFHEALSVVERARQTINRWVSTYHPDPRASLNLPASPTMRGGQGIRVAVFDVFDETLLEKQRTHYDKARIEPLRAFGNPVTMNHGNSVIDAILTMAPQVTVVPVAADTSGYTDALRWVRRRGDFDILNMSRALLERGRSHGLDPTFRDVLLDLAGSIVVTKALGNSGTDLAGAPSPVRVASGLGPLGNAMAYDGPLVASFCQALEARPRWQPDNFLLALNANPFATGPSPSATIPGNSKGAQKRTLAVPGDGIYSFATDNFEAGSSFAAAQLAGLSALRLRERRDRLPREPAVAARRAVATELKTLAHPKGPPSLWGLGTP